MIPLRVHVDEDLSEDEALEYAKCFVKQFGALSERDLRKLRRKQRALFQDVDLEMTTCSVKELIGAGFSRHFARKIEENRNGLYLQEDLIQPGSMSSTYARHITTTTPCYTTQPHTAGNGGIGLKLSHIKKIILGGFVLRLHGTVVDWNKLKVELENRKLSPTQRKKLEYSKMDKEMKDYWSKAVKLVEDGKTNPDRLIDQPFVHARIKAFHEVGFCILHV